MIGHSWFTCLWSANTTWLKIASKKPVWHCKTVSVRGFVNTDLRLLPTFRFLWHLWSLLLFVCASRKCLDQGAQICIKVRNKSLEGNNPNRILPEKQVFTDEERPAKLLMQLSTDKPASTSTSRSPLCSETDESCKQSLNKGQLASKASMPACLRHCSCWFSPSFDLGHGVRQFWYMYQWDVKTHFLCAGFEIVGNNNWQQVYVHAF